MPGTPVVARVTGHHVDLGLLPAAAAAEGHSFVDRTLNEWHGGTNRFDRPGEGFFLATNSDDVVGMCGLNVDPFLDDDFVGRIRHLYVLSSARRGGVGTTLVTACLELAAAKFDRVRLRTFDTQAAAFYIALGFREVSEPDATHELLMGSTQ